MNYPKPKQFYIDEDDDKKLTALVNQTGQSISQVLRDAIKTLYYETFINPETTD